jgi:hypothetical protein
MSSKSVIMLGMTIGSFVGGYVPVLFGADSFSYSSLFGSTIGGFVGVYLGYKITHY